jgi:hypothetical protein
MIMSQGSIFARSRSLHSFFSLHLSLFTLLFVLVTSLTLGLACSSQPGDAGGIKHDADYSSSNDYDVRVVHTSSSMVVGKANPGSIDAVFVIVIKNRGEQPVTVERISLQSIRGSYFLDNSSHLYQRTIAAGGSERFSYAAPAHVASTVDTFGPVVVQAVVDTTVNGARQRETFNRQVPAGASRPWDIASN